MHSCRWQRSMAAAGGAAGAGCAAVKLRDENKRCGVRVLERIEHVSGEHGQGKGKKEMRLKVRSNSGCIAQGMVKGFSGGGGRGRHGQPHDGASENSKLANKEVYCFRGVIITAAPGRGLSLFVSPCSESWWPMCLFSQATTAHPLKIIQLLGALPPLQRGHAIRPPHQHLLSCWQCRYCGWNARQRDQRRVPSQLLPSTRRCN